MLFQLNVGYVSYMSKRTESTTAVTPSTNPHCKETLLLEALPVMVSTPGNFMSVGNCI